MVTEQKYITNLSASNLEFNMTIKNQVYGCCCEIIAAKFRKRDKKIFSRNKYY